LLSSALKIPDAAIIGTAKIIDIESLFHSVKDNEKNEKRVQS
jgi:hypothetical protein